MFRVAFLSFLVGFILVGAACSNKPATTPTQAPSATPAAMTQPDVSKADEDAPLSSSTDVDSLQKDLDNTNINSVNSSSSQVQSELNQ